MAHHAVRRGGANLYAETHCPAEGLATACSLCKHPLTESRMALEQTPDDCSGLALPRRIHAAYADWITSASPLRPTG